MAEGRRRVAAALRTHRGPRSQKVRKHLRGFGTLCSIYYTKRKVEVEWRRSATTESAAAETMSPAPT